MGNVKVDIKKTKISDQDLIKYAKDVKKIHHELHGNRETNKDPIGWLDWPEKYNKKEFENIKKCAEKIRKDTDVLLVIGIGGSYLGARAVIESLTNTFYNMQEKSERKGPQILYVGNNLNPNYINDIMDLIIDKDISVNVISKS